MVRDAIRRYVEAAQSLTDIPRERAERIAHRLAGSGLIGPDQIRAVAADIVERSRENRRRVTDLVTSEIRRQASRIGFASKDEVERLRQRVQALEVAQRRTKQSEPRAPRPQKSTKKASPARKRPAARR